MLGKNGYRSYSLGFLLLLGLFVNPIFAENTVEASTKLAEPKEIVSNTNNADFVDPSKDPYHYVERYYTEPSYKSWFDRNYPDQTIEESVGYTHNFDDTESVVREIIDNEIIPEAQASSVAQPIQKTTNKIPKIRNLLFVRS